MTTVAENLNSSRSPCCQEKARFNLWDDEDEARLHRRVTAAVARIDEIILDFNKVSDKRRESERAKKELTSE
jgi:hypothetical protein